MKLAEERAQGLFKDVSSIRQIKGSSKKDDNQRIRLTNTGYPDNPDAHLLPYIQDFVKSGKWSDIQDMEHTGLRRSADAFGETELNRYRANNIEVPEYITEAERLGLDDKWNTLPEGFAKGGLVTYNPEHINKRATDLAIELGL